VETEIGSRSTRAAEREIDPWHGPRRVIALLALVLGLLAAPDAAQAAGELDPTFDGDGKLTTDFGATEGVEGVAIQPDGKIVAAGTTVGGPDFALARYNPDGSLDPTFEGDGRVVTDFGGSDLGAAVAVQADGKIVVAGLTNAGASYADFALARYNQDGSLDPSFDGDGKVVTEFGGYDSAEGVVVQADGKIVAAGYHRGPTPESPGNFALARYNPDGSLDPTFDGDGRVLTDFGSHDLALDVALQADGNIVAAGFSIIGTTEFALARYKPDGSLDSSFEGDGKVLTDFATNADEAHSVAIQTNGKIVAAGFTRGLSSPDFALARYNNDGSLDSSFDGDGRVRTDFGTAEGSNDVAVQADGRIVVVGSLGPAGFPAWDFALARYSPSGSLDPSFDADGKARTDFASSGDRADGVAIQADGRIVAAGDSDGDFALARYIADSPQISINDVTKLEGNAGLTSFTFTVSLSRASSQTITVSYQTVDGTASAPSDYTALAPAPLTFSPGQTTKTVTVKVNGDVGVEPNETFFVRLSSPHNVTIADAFGKGTIGNDDLSASASCTITGTNHNDVLTGTSGNEVICGGRGDDQIYGFGGNDVLKGESGNDLLLGGIGYDLLIGDVGADDLRGEDGNDTLRGGDRDDTVDGGAGSDALFGDAGADSLNTQDGVSANDSADGGSDSDSCVFDSSDFVTSCP
jgi:uncharacterized delta-60 repeat protein